MPAFLGLLALMVAVGMTSMSANAQAIDHVATPGSPALVPIVGSLAERAPQGYLELTVEAYRPSLKGAAEVVVTVENSGMRVEVGRFGLSGRRGFDHVSGDTVQRFSFPLPPGLAMEPNAKLSVELIGNTGNIEGAAVRVSDGRLRF
jgi:hypothetical protein